jgi:ABC-2 type transport system ATP-binding protein
VERVADRVGILRHGHLVIVEPLASLKRKAIRRIDLEFDEPVDASVFEGLAGVHSAEARGNTVVVSFEGSVNALLRAALDHNVVNINSREADLEQIFLTYYKNGGPDAA